MLRVLYVSSNGSDFAAVTYESLSADEQEEIIQKAEEAFKNGSTYEFDGIEYEIREFDDVDPEFIDFVQSIQDYDQSKDSNFYVLDN